MSLFLDPERKFFVVTSFSRVTEEFVVVAILSDGVAAKHMAECYQKSDKHANVGSIQELSTEEIKTLLLKEHLGDLYDLLVGEKNAKV